MTPVTSTSPAMETDRARWIRGVVAATLVLGALLLAATINVQRNSTLFVVAGIALALVWTVGFSLTQDWRRHFQARPGADTAIGIVVGAGMFGAFVAAAWVARRSGILEGSIDEILHQADDQALAPLIAVTAINGVAEELFFRGALMNALSAPRALVVSTALYVAVTFAGGNIALALASAVMGTLFAAERRLTNALVMPIATHLVWSVLMITAFPRS